jgi:hypothetical protein
VKNAKLRENSDFMMDINEINVELSENVQRYINQCCKSESNGKLNGFGAGYCKCRGALPLLCSFIQRKKKNTPSSSHKLVLCLVAKTTSVARVTCIARVTSIDMEMPIAMAMLMNVYPSQAA